MKRAVTDCAAFIVTTHAPVPVQPPPLQPAKLEQVAGVAVKVTLEEAAKETLHCPPHLSIPAGLLETVPVAPLPSTLTVSTNSDWALAAPPTMRLERAVIKAISQRLGLLFMGCSSGV